MVREKEMEKYWKHLSVVYMTEKSDDTADANVIIEHKLPWRSKSILVTHIHCYIQLFWN